eukprot:1140722-Amphidinium_carterae.1
MEWSLLSKQHVQEQLALGKDFIVCSQHKTSATYGDLRKWLSPGLIKAFDAYLSLPTPTSYMVLLACPCMVAFAPCVGSLVSGLSVSCYPACASFIALI